MTIFSDLFQDIERGAADRIIRWTDGVLAEGLTGGRALDAVRHPLGFVCFPVHRHGDEGVCLHLWGPRWRLESPTTSPTHCHSWDLLSWVLVGELRNQTLRVDDTGSPTHRVFEVYSGPDGDEIRATEQLVRVAVAEDTAYRAGESYRLPAGLFHQTVELDSVDLLVTVVLGRTTPGVADLSLGGIHTASHHVRRQSCDAADTVLAAETIRQALTSQCA